MSVTPVHKRSNPEVARLRRIREGKEESFLFCEGVRIVEELFRSSLKINALYFQKDTQSIAVALASRKGNRIPLFTLSQPVMEYVSDLESPPGLIAVAQRPTFTSLPQPPKSSPALYLILHGLQLPQNVGALVRTAEASGVDAVLTTRGTADAFGPKSIRASSGSVFRVPFQSFLDLATLSRTLGERGVSIAAALPAGTIAYDAFDWRQPVGVVIGSEGGGIQPKEMAFIEHSVRIPMKGKTESLNAGIAAAVCLFEAARQRGVS